MGNEYWLTDAGYYISSVFDWGSFLFSNASVIELIMVNIMRNVYAYAIVDINAFVRQSVFSDLSIVGQQNAKTVQPFEILYSLTICIVHSFRRRTSTIDPFIVLPERSNTSNNQSRSFRKPSVCECKLCLLKKANNYNLIF